jgi:hypothetical protein
MNLRRALLLAFLAATLAGTWWLTPDSAATREVDVGLKRALASFATARTLDAIVSAAQGTELSMQPLGVGVTLAPGEALDPINDLIEQFAGLMLAASVSFGAQRVLIAAGGHWIVSALLSVAAIGWVAWQWRTPPPEAKGWVSRWLPRVLVLLLLIRFAVPLAVLGADAGFRLLMADDYAAGQAALDRSAGAMRELSPPTVSPSAEPASDAGTLERLKRWWSGPADAKPGPSAAAPSRIEQWQALIGDAVEHIVALIVVFLMQTLVLPLLMLWLLLGLVRRVIGDMR